MGQPYMPVQFWTFHFVKQLGRKAAYTQNHRSGLRHAVQLDSVVLVFWAICPSLALFGGGAGPAPVTRVSQTLVRVFSSVEIGYPRTNAADRSVDYSAGRRSW
jgi:hypothetical protein